MRWRPAAIWEKGVLEERFCDVTEPFGAIYLIREIYSLSGWIMNASTPAIAPHAPYFTNTDESLKEASRIRP